ncbi:MAG: heme lyase CcmF/NrfE family subunit [Gemmatimonadales bacterium]|nr:heme lyase CcmF/NrfE family subunit [Gemmatimonadales bacterium]
MTLLGQFCLWLALIASAWGAGVAFAGRWRTRPELAGTATASTYGVCAALLVAAACLWKGLFAHDFNIEYVAQYTSRNLPEYYVFSAFWAGQKGSLLFWATILSIFGATVQTVTSRRHAELMPYVAGITNVVVAFFILTMLFAANPFERLPFTPEDGRGLNPQLQNPGMTIHPPMLYLGYISITIPFAFAMASLLSKRLDTGWIHAMRKWTILSWLFLSAGITLGMWWAYVELGWGGYWAWDPVENASLLPWLTMTAFLHSVMIQEKRGMLKRWNVGLVVASFLLSIFGTFITRSGIIASVHSFAQGNVGTFFLVFLILITIASSALLYARWPLLEPEAELESLASREAAFLFNNLALVGIAFSVLWGTLFPILSEAVQGTKITVGPPFFNRVNVPLGLFLLALTGIGPLIAWRKASAANLQRQFIVPSVTGLVVAVALLAIGIRDGWALAAWTLAGFVLGTVGQEFWRGIRARVKIHGESVLLAFNHLISRNRRRYGGYIVHVGILTYFVAFAGMAFKVTQEVTLSPGESAELKSPYGHTYRFTHLGVSQYDQLNRWVSAASLDVRKDGVPQGRITSEKRQHKDSFGRNTFEPSTEVGIWSNAREDLYVVYAGSVGGTDRATYAISINPLVMWVWLGAGILIVGGLITMWPGGAVVGSRRRTGVEAGYQTPLTDAAIGSRPEGAGIGS